MTRIPNLSVPAGATADDWCTVTNEVDDWARSLTWSRHDAGGAGVSVDGCQYWDGRVDRFVAVYDVGGKELTAVAARQLAAALLEAADALDGLQ